MEPRREFFFVRIPKTASTSLSKVYRSLTDHSVPVLFAVIRDPVDRFVSAYYYKRANGGWYENMYNIDEFLELDFLEFDECYIPQYKYCEGVSIFIRFEYMKEDLIKHGLYKGELPVKNVGKRGNPPKDIEKLKKIYEKDYELLSSL